MFYQYIYAFLGQNVCSIQSFSEHNAFVHCPRFTLMLFGIQHPCPFRISLNHVF